jgi:hypothetical protein
VGIFSRARARIALSWRCPVKCFIWVVVEKNYLKHIYNQISPNLQLSTNDVLSSPFLTSVWRLFHPVFKLVMNIYE